MFVALVFSVVATSFAQDDGLLLYYPCDDKKGGVLADAGPAHANGLLNAQLNGEVRGASVICEKAGEWIPILTADGVQCKGLVAGSDAALAEGERPIVLDRDKDYAIDSANGRIKALPGGRVEIGSPFTLDFKFSNPGPSWAEGKAGGCLKLDGVDDYVTLGRQPAANSLEAVTLQCWICLSKDGSPDAVILTKGSGGKIFGLRLKGGVPQFFHPGLKTAEGKSAPATQGKDALARETWHHLAAIFDGSNAILVVDGRETARQTSLTGKLETIGDFHVGGLRDPEFFGGCVDEIKIYGRARSQEEIAKEVK